MGGKNTFMYGGMKGTGLEDMMPVSFDFDETDSEDNIALMLVLDCSRSMTNNNSPNLSVAKQGAIKCVESMTENDYIGLVTFHTDADLSCVRHLEGELTLPAIVLKTADDQFCVGWLASQTDLLADDWQIV